MSVLSKIEQIEGRLHAAGKDVGALCRASGIARSTWSRWKAGKNLPNLKTWLEVEAAVDRLCAPTPDAKAKTA